MVPVALAFRSSVAAASFETWCGVKTVRVDAASGLSRRRGLLARFGPRRPGSSRRQGRVPPLLFLASCQLFVCWVSRVIRILRVSGAFRCGARLVSPAGTSTGSSRRREISSTARTELVVRTTRSRPVGVAAAGPAAAVGASFFSDRPRVGGAIGDLSDRFVALARGLCHRAALRPGLSRLVRPFVTWRFGRLVLLFPSALLSPGRALVVGHRDRIGLPGQVSWRLGPFCSPKSGVAWWRFRPTVLSVSSGSSRVSRDTRVEIDRSICCRSRVSAGGGSCCAPCFRPHAADRLPGVGTLIATRRSFSRPRWGQTRVGRFDVLRGTCLGCGPGRSPVTAFSFGVRLASW